MSRRNIGVAFAVLFAGCATSPLGRSQFMFVGDADMDKLGVEAFEQLKTKGKISGDSQSNAYVTCVANAITAVLDPGKIPGGAGPWEVRVFQDDTANAFALPGRKIGVHTGLLKVAKNQDQLATVIGHEVAHVMARHGAERVSDQQATELAAGGLGALLGTLSDPANPSHGAVMAAIGVGVGAGSQLSQLGFSRTHESEADRLGLDYMASAGFDPRESIALWQNMAAASKGQPIEFLSTHPSHETRIQDLQRRIPQNLPTMEQAHASGHNPHCH
jgi:predicted Zn-dependent protease